VPVAVCLERHGLLSWFLCDRDAQSEASPQLNLEVGRLKAVGKVAKNALVT